MSHPLSPNHTKSTSTMEQLNKNISEFESHIGYSYKNRENAVNALIHSSFANEHPHLKVKSNERLEFMGDALLDFIFSVILYNDHPSASEGFMSRLRAKVVCEASLAKAADELNLGSFLLLGRGEDNSGGRTRSSILADAVEAVIGSIYLDGGMECAHAFVQRILDDAYRKAERGDIFTDYKTKLQEIHQKSGTVQIDYKIMECSGPDGVSVNGKHLGSGTGHSKKEAEQEAAKTALEMNDL
jgi:ribonuclease-3